MHIIRYSGLEWGNSLGLTCIAASLILVEQGVSLPTNVRQYL